MQIRYGVRTLYVNSQADPTSENRRIVFGDQLQAALETAILQGCEAIELFRLTVLPRNAQGGGINLRDATLQRLSIIGCDFRAGMTLNRVRVSDCHIAQTVLGSSVRGGFRATECRIEERLVLTTNSRNRQSGPISLRGTVLAKGGTLTLDAVRLDLTRTVFGARSLIAADDDARAAGRWTELTSMVHATVRDLTLVSLSLRYCRLRDAHGLDSLHFDNCRWPHSFGTVRRRVAYEEKLFRHGLPCRGWTTVTAPARWPWRMLRGINLGGWEGSSHLDLRQRTSARQVEAVYRALHRGAVHDGNHAIAAQYAWGAYTMRRLSGRDDRVEGRRALRVLFSSGSADRLLVRGYRVVGGYGVRARWPIACLLLVWLSFAAFMGSQGFASDSIYCQEKQACWSGTRGDLSARRFERATVHSVATALSLARPSPAQVSSRGSAAIALTRLLTVALLGFAALAIRSRLRR